MEFATQPLGPQHERGAFNCGVPSLDRYLKEQASQDIRRDVARCYVRCMESSPEIAGYYTLSAASIDLQSLPEARARRLPRYPALPAALIGRLAVHAGLQRQRLGELLLTDALHRCLDVEREIAIMVVVVDAESDSAVRFYEHFEFTRLADLPMRLFLPMSKVRSMFRG